ncbi:glycosyl transferase [Aeromonas bestiarum]|uniref:Colanic acid biosynthesis glycosyl transferase n=1 Tax=Aeromonas bestiarum TaxID=105751 RepID=A0A068FS42_9GAMM|nr:glycosyltransferase family 2 protein [Aeromonas bestiarum]AID70962.1 colanic acid biosynthesis glycosyl transferase [Aeromonas bestiarum]POG24552.1 glycosyl transferase [Aeromonas bestiarum]
MKVSIITATYNSAATINDTLASLESQTYHDIEYIIVDGASKDNTLEVIKNNCTRVSKIISEPDQGIYDALNKGIAVATGEIVGFLHSDDLFANNDSVANLVAAFKAGDHNAVYADLDYVDKENTNKVIRHWVSGNFKSYNLQLGWMPAHPTFYMSKAMYKKLGDFSLDFPIAADYDSILRYFNSGEIKAAYLPQVLVKMRVGGASNNSLQNVKRKIKEEIVIMRRNRVCYPLALVMKRLTKLHQYFN